VIATLTTRTNTTNAAKTTTSHVEKRSLAIFVCFVVFVSVVPCAGAPELLPRFDVHFDGQYLVSSDDRFNWAFDLGGDIDVVDWGGGRATFVANYEALAGEEFRRFDVNQGNYLLEGVLSFRVRRIEVAAVWHHVSRHLSDRGKRFAIDWNMIAARVGAPWTLGRVSGSWRADLRKTITNAFVDYDWELESAGQAVRPLTSRYAAVAAATARVVGVDGSRGRGTQAAGRAEAGVRLNGRAAAAELFVGVERRVDPYPVEFGTANWVLAGLRLMSVP
jgi:hypothetical protein